MKMHQVTGTVFMALACVPAICQTRTETASAIGTRYLIQAFAGFNQPNTLGLPCASPCFGLPAGTVAVQPNQFVSGNSSGLYYAVFQTNGWTGELSITFSLSEAGAVVQTMTVTGSISLQQARSAVVLSGSATIPQSAFIGPATLTASTLATPSNGAKPSTLKSYSTLQVGGAGARRLVQAFAGISSSNGDTGIPCAYPKCPTANFPGTVAIQPAQFQGFPADGTAYYSVFQANGWQGDVAGTAAVLQGGRVLYSIPLGGAIAGPQEAFSVILFGSSGAPLQGGSTGPAILTVTTTATQPGNQFTLTSYAPIQVQ